MLMINIRVIKSFEYVAAKAVGKIHCPLDEEKGLLCMNPSEAW
jgi:hypothetical protein